MYIMMIMIIIIILIIIIIKLYIYIYIYQCSYDYYKCYHFYADPYFSVEDFYANAEIKQCFLFPESTRSSRATSSGRGALLST